MGIPRPKLSLLPIFFLSGFSALTYEIIWARMLSIVFGSTVEAISAVVTAFMSGLAIGSYFMGKWADGRKDILLIYSLTELAIGIISLSFYFIIISLPDIYYTLNLNIENAPFLFYYNGRHIRYALQFLLVAAPTLMIGATFPLMVKAYISSRNYIGEGSSIIYAVNTFGAVIGAFFGGFFLMPLFGIRMTLFIAVFINIALALAIYLIRRFRLSAPSGTASADNTIKLKELLYSTESSKTPPLIGRSVMAILALSGFAAMAYQIAWTRLLSMVIGNSVYAFSAILTTFLAGIAMGSLLFVRQIDRVKDKLLLLGIVQGVLFLTVILCLPLMDSLPALFIALFRGLSGTFLGLALIDFIIVSSAIFIPTLLMGITFPIAIRIYTNKTDLIGEEAGMLYSINTIGCIFGAFLTGFYFIPLFGVQKTIIAISGLNLVAAVIFILQSETLRYRMKAIAASASVAFYFLSLLMMPQWNVGLLNLGVYFNADFFQMAEGHMIGMKRFYDESKLIYYEEGTGGTVGVTEAHNHLSLQINGKTDGGTSTVDIPPQILVSAFPLIMHPDPKFVEIIGLGSGISTGTATMFPVSKIACIELLPEVVKANRFFSSFNHDALKDERVNLIIDDARHHLTYHEQKYDVIISEPSNPWITGVSNLFTLEFFEIVKSRLKEGGIMSQWIQLNSLDTKELKVLLNTFKTVFPYVTVWASSPQDLVVLGSKSRMELDPSRTGSAFQIRGIKEELQKVGINNPEDLFGRYMMGDKELERFCRSAGLNTDDHPVIEFEAPKALYTNTSPKNLSAILSTSAEMHK